jgi:hypothetical protein
MNQQDQPNKKTMTAKAAAEYLSKALGEKPAFWETWLANDRRPNRVNRLIPVVPGPGRPRYAVAAVDAYIEVCDAKNSSPVLTALSERATRRSRRFTPHIYSLKAEDGAEKPMVILITHEPLRLYELSVAEARQIATRFINAAEEIEEEARCTEHTTPGVQHDESKGETAK